MLEENTIHLGDCLDLMRLIPDKSIDLVITSPPYDNLREYNGAIEGWCEEKSNQIIDHLFLKIKDGGTVVWIVGDATVNGSETGSSFKQALYFKNIGFNIHDTMIWNKGGFSAVGALQNRYAPVFEYMFIFTKGPIKTFNPLKDRQSKHGGKYFQGTVRKPDGSTKPISKKGIVNQYGQRFNIWDCSPQRTRVNYPAPFPLNLIQDHILSWSNPNDLILDPFSGSGTTAIAAHNLGRRFICIEKDEDYHAASVQRLKDTQAQLRLF
jgi:DNA modification methylase